jgi:HEPN domain-containing protein
MGNETLVEEWYRFAKMDYETAIYLYDTMYPMPYEIVCYHCQQATEKLLKGLMVKYGIELRKTHDLGLLAEQLADKIEIPERIYDICDELTPYGVKIRYPQELFIDKRHVDTALKGMKIIFQWHADTIIS